MLLNASSGYYAFIINVLIASYLVTLGSVSVIQKIRNWSLIGGGFVISCLWISLLGFSSFRLETCHCLQCLHLISHVIQKGVCVFFKKGKICCLCIVRYLQKMFSNAL